MGDIVHNEWNENSEGKQVRRKQRHFCICVWGGRGEGMNTRDEQFLSVKDRVNVEELICV